MRIFAIESTRFNGSSEPVSLAIGNFDGLHKGHQAVITEAIETANERGIHSGVITFYPHPRTILRGERTEVLTPREDKMEILTQMGVSRLYCIHFTQAFARLTPEQFVKEILIPIGTRHIAVGYDFHFGYKGEGTADSLRQMGDGRFSVTIVPPILDGERRISSSLIRSLIAEGEMEEAASYLGRCYKIRGVVIHGEKRGRLLGFPTANLSLVHPYPLPAAGVYGVKVKVRGREACGVTNIGVKPTFAGERKVSVEVHLIDEADDFYGEILEVSFAFRIREERKFPTIEALQSQIAMDIQFARERFL